MSQHLFLILYSLFFTLITWHKFHHGLFLLFLLLPTYLIRFNIGPLPTTLLEVMIWIICIIWLIKIVNKKTISYLLSFIYKHKLFLISIILFLLAATISIFTSVDTHAALGQWKAFYIEPFLIFIILITTVNQQPSTNKNTSYKLLITSYILPALIISGLITSLLAIYQHFTGFLVPHAFWANNETHRVTAWYGFPNGVGLFLAPLVPFALYLVITKFKELKTTNIEYRIWNIIIIISCLLSLVSLPLAIFYSKSTGGLIGTLAGIGLLLLIYKKTRLITVAVGIVGLVSLASLPQLSNIKQELLFQDRSGQIRLSIYNETWQFLKDHPIAGAGLASYSEKIKSYHTTVNGEGIEIFHHPHNIFLTIWVNLGLLGLIGFILILVTGYRLLVTDFKKNRQIPLTNYFLIASLTTILITGLVDSPYIKNDLSVFFWMLIALALVTQNKSANVDTLEKK